MMQDYLKRCKVIIKPKLHLLPRKEIKHLKGILDPEINYFK